MPQVNHTIDNTNPLIQYRPVGAWLEGSKTSDSLAFEYSNNGTFTTSTVAQSSASFVFNGSAVWIFGAKRGNHGTYSIDIDNTVSQYDGFAADPGLFQIPLFSAPLLKQGPHTVTITNTRTSANRPFLDIDFITWTSELGNATNIISEKVVQDTDPAFSYQPSSNWNTSDLAGFNGTAHATFEANSSLTCTFTGDSITLFGAIGPNSSPYSVQLDSGHASNFNATKPEYTPQVPLYHADNLGGGYHTLHVVNHPDVSGGQALAIDYVILSNAGGNNFSALSQGGGSGGASSGNDPSVSSLSGSLEGKPAGPGVNTAVIGGLIAGLLILLGIIGAFVYLRWRRKFWRMTLQEQGVILDEKPAIDNKLPPESFMYSPYPRDFTSGQSGTDHLPPVHRGSIPTIQNSGVPPLRAVNGDEIGSTPAPRPDSNKGLVISLPPTAGQSLAHIPASELFSRRMVVQGRAKDFGSLPPDYIQATQSYTPEH